MSIRNRGWLGIGGKAQRGETTDSTDGHGLLPAESTGNPHPALRATLSQREKDGKEKGINHKKHNRLKRRGEGSAQGRELGIWGKGGTHGFHGWRAGARPPPARLRADALVLPTPPQGGSDGWALILIMIMAVILIVISLPHYQILHHVPDPLPAQPYQVTERNVFNKSQPSSAFQRSSPPSANTQIETFLIPHS